MNSTGTKYDVVVVGELNVDLILNQIDSFPEVGKEKFARDMAFTLGSSAAIFASNLSRLGARVAFVGMVGDDLLGDFVVESLQKRGVDTSMVIKNKLYKTGATIGMNFTEDRAMVTYQGAMEHFSFADIPPAVFESAKHLHFSSYFFQPAIKKDVARMFKSAREKGMTTSFDIQCDPSEKWQIDYAEILPYVNVFLPNEVESMKITGKDNVDAALEELRRFSAVLAVKLGTKGSVVCAGSETNYMPAMLHEYTVDAIGAGDSFDAGFVYQFLQQSSLEQCQEFANLTGSYSTRAAGGTSAFDDINTFYTYAKQFTETGSYENER